jgi:hypothetical protein
MTLFNKKNIPFFLLFLIVFISRVPFLSAGYGVEEDSWGIAMAAFQTKMSGVFEPSRLPGHPVQELIYSALWGAGPIVFNGLCAFFSAVGAVFFALILQQLKFKHFLFAAFALAFVPVYFISSTYTIDFVWTEAFVLISLYALLKNRLVVSGVFLGLAIGCRITSGAMLLPFMMIIWQDKNLKQNFINLLKISIPMGVVAIVSFIPIIAQYGLSFFMYYDQFPYPSMAKLVYKMVFGVFGFVGVMAIAIAVLSILLNKEKQKNGELFETQLNRKIIAASFTILILFFISYLRLPQKSGYMLPILPFVILLFGYYLNSKKFKIVCGAFILSSFVCSINLTDKIRGAEHSKYAFVYTISGQEIFFDALSGPIFSDYSKRIQKEKYVESVIKKTEKVTAKTVVISGWWYNEISVWQINRPINKNVSFEFYIDSAKINKYLAQEYEITYLPEQNIYNDLMFKMQVTDSVAKPF